MDYCCGITILLLVLMDSCENAFKITENVLCELILSFKSVLEETPDMYFLQKTFKVSQNALEFLLRTISKKISPKKFSIISNRLPNEPNVKQMSE